MRFAFPRMSLLVATLLVTAQATLVAAAEPSSNTPMQPWMAQRGKLIFSESFEKTSLTPTWRIGKGTWEVVDGTLKGVELKDDKHAATIRTTLGFHDAIIQFSFKRGNGRATHLSINGKGGHVCRVTVMPTGFVVRKDKLNRKSTDKAEILGRATHKFQSGKWYTMLVEIRGEEMLARIDDKTYAFGQSAGVDVAKTNFGFPSAGEATYFDNVQVWEALPNKAWQAKKKELAR